MMSKILVADDHQLIREGFKNVINNEVDMEVVGEAENSAEVIEFLHSNSCDVVVLDITMPGRSGLDILKEIHEINSDIKVLILSMHPEDRFALRAVKSGADGYITKERAPKEIVSAIRKVKNGGKYISDKLTVQLIDELKDPEQGPPHNALSGREYEVFELLAQGISVAEIAEELSLSQSTINTYRHRIFEKMHMSSNAEIIRYALTENLIE